MQRIKLFVVGIVIAVCGLIGPEATKKGIIEWVKQNFDGVIECQ